jgi:hypothetical protein
MYLAKQLEFFHSRYKYDANLFGGAMGPGKTYILIWTLVAILLDLAKSGVKKPTVAMFSSTYPNLMNRHVRMLPRILPEWLGATTNTRDFPGIRYRGLGGTGGPEYVLAEEYGGGTILFLNLADAEQYKSVEFAAIAIDEITEILEPIFDFLNLRKRYPGVKFVPVLAATNPTGPGRAWVYRRFVDPITRDKPRINEKMIRDGKPYQSKGFNFIAALPSDNPILSDQIRDVMMNMPEKYRRAYDEGDWSVFEGMYFSMLEPAVQQYDESSTFIDPKWPRFRAIDSGYAHPTVCLWGAVSPDNTLWVYREYSKSLEYAEYHKEQIVLMSIDNEGRPEQYVRTVGDRNMFGDRGSSYRNQTISEVYNADDKFGTLHMQKAYQKNKTQGWRELVNGLSFQRQISYQEGVPIVTITRPPKVRISSGCPYTWNSLTTRTHDERNAENVKKTTGMYGPGQGDDETDDLLYLYMSSIFGLYGDEEDRARIQVFPAHAIPSHQGETFNKKGLYNNIWAK